MYEISLPSQAGCVGKIEESGRKFFEGRQLRPAGVDTIWIAEKGVPDHQGGANWSDLHFCASISLRDSRGD